MEHRHTWIFPYLMIQCIIYKKFTFSVSRASDLVKANKTNRKRRLGEVFDEFYFLVEHPLHCKIVVCVSSVIYICQMDTLTSNFVELSPWSPWLDFGFRSARNLFHNESVHFHLFLVQWLNSLLLPLIKEEALTFLHSHYVLYVCTINMSPLPFSQPSHICWWELLILIKTL